MRLLFTVFLMLVLAAVGLVFFVNPNQYKDLIASKIEEKIHRPFAINGDITWRFLPSVGFTLEGVQIGQAKSNATFAEIKEVHVYPELAPLFNKQVNIHELSLIDAKFYVSPQTTVTVSHVDANMQLDLKTSAPNGFIDVTVHNALIDGNIFSGNLNAQANLNVSDTQNGSGQFNIDKGSIHGIDLSYWLTVGESLLKSNNLLDLAKLPIEAIQLSNMKQTTFDKLEGTFKITNGIFENNDLVVYSPSFYATASGSVDLQKQYINYALRISRSQNSNMKIPLLLSGNFSHPTIGIDPKGIQSIVVDTAKVGIKDTINQAVPLIQSGQPPEQVIKDTIKNLIP